MTQHKQFHPSLPANVTHGLIVPADAVEMIMRGEKIWELRHTRTRKRGLIALIPKGTSRIAAVCNLVDVVGPLGRGDMDATRDLHRFSASWFDKQIDDKREIYAWVTQDVRKLSVPLTITQPRGSRVWVRLTDDVLTSPMVRH